MRRCPRPDVEAGMTVYMLFEALKEGVPATGYPPARLDQGAVDVGVDQRS